MLQLAPPAPAAHAERGKCGLKIQLPQAPPRTSLCDALDKLLDTGVVVAGELTIKVAGVELLYVAVELVAGSWENLCAAPGPVSTPAAERNAEWIGRMERTICDSKLK